MAQSANPLPPAGATGTNLMSIDPQINWRRYPSVPITADMVTPAYVPPIEHTTADPSLGADATNDGETGTLSVAYNSDAPYADTGAYAPKSQLAKAGLPNLTPGTVIAPDVGKSYGAGERGDVEPFAAYPSAAGTPTSDDIPDAFKPAALVVPAPPEPEP